MRKHMLILSALCSWATLMADEVPVKQFRHAGPFEVRAPYLINQQDVNSQAYTDKSLLKTDLPFSHVRETGAPTEDATSLGNASTGNSLHLAAFYLNSDRYTDGKLIITGLNNYELYIDNEKKTIANGEIALTLEPRRYEVIIKYLLHAGESAAALSVKYKTESQAIVTATTDPEKRYTLSDVFDGTRIRSVALSPNGKYLLTRYQTTFPGGDTQSYQQLTELASGKMIIESADKNLQWMPRSNKLYYTRRGMQGNELIQLDPVTLTENVMAASLPEGYFTIAPTEEFLIVSANEEGPKKGEDLQEILTPDDRQPGWRSRTSLYRFDLGTGLCERLTFGHLSAHLNDIAEDGQTILFSYSEPDLTKRPFATNIFCQMNLSTHEVKQLIKDPFVNHAQYAPDGKQLLVSASAEAFDKVGLNILPGQTSNTGDSQLFLFDLATGAVTPLTKEFDPAVRHAEWRKADGLIYVQAEDRDRVHFYTIDPAKGKIQQLPTREDLMSGYSLAQTANEWVYYGESASNSQRLYRVDLKKLTTTCIQDLSATILQDVTLGEVHDWNFQAAAGDTIYGRFYLPPHFDPNKKYPLIVNYYGGTSPTARALESRYPSHVYAALGYVVYILQPSGATGFGQEFSARHVNAWGKRTADEIIEGTEKFCAEHSFVDKKKIGCIGASYGGFMSQFLQTKTDLFATAISHAGISDITSYWGEGYWGYSYSSLASANSYPWNAPEMYTKQSPLFNADKINTSILFLHGTEDTNVPIGESIQMFTALKLLGKPTAFIQVVGENHQIFDYKKRAQWNKTIYAWFARWLKDQPEWWDAMYPEKSL